MLIRLAQFHSIDYGKTQSRTARVFTIVLNLVLSLNLVSGNLNLAFASGNSVNQKSNNSTPEAIQKVEHDLADEDMLTFENGSKRKEPAGLPEMGSILLRILGSVIVVLLLIYLVQVLIRRFWVRSHGKGGINKFFKILGTVFIGPKKSICLVKAYDRVLVLGITEDKISMLTELEESSLLERLDIVEGTTKSETAFEFPAILKSMFTKSTGSTSGHVLSDAIVTSKGVN